MLRCLLLVPVKVLLSLSMVVSNSVMAGAITFNTAMPVAEGEFIFRQQLRWLQSSDDPSEADRDMRVIVAISVLGYGVNSKLAIFGILPYVDKTLEMNSTGMEIKRDNQGQGDATIFARYTLWQDDAKGRTFRLSGIGGFTAPTGDDNKKDGFGPLPPSMQNGSGAWDWTGGIVATYQTLGYQLDGQFSYRDNREANNFEAGDEIRLDLSWQYRLWPRKLTGGVPGFFYGVLEANYLHQDKNYMGGQNDHNSGGDTVWLSPGVQYVTKRWVLEAVVQKPISQNLNGSALKNDQIVTTSFRMNF
ncbi:MAG: transporter [Pseudomonadales bacterium]|nr:transporter [Pseudomonadales bacterium]